MVMSAATKPVTVSEKVIVIGIGDVLVGLETVEDIVTVGRMLSTTKALILLAGLCVVPLLCALAYTVCEPCAKSVGWVNEKAPTPVAVVVPIALPFT